jgi:hypothetical protein
VQVLVLVFELLEVRGGLPALFQVFYLFLLRSALRLQLQVALLKGLQCRTELLLQLAYDTLIEVDYLRQLLPR